MGPGTHIGWQVSDSQKRLKLDTTLAVGYDARKSSGITRISNQDSINIQRSTAPGVDFALERWSALVPHQTSTSSLDNVPSCDHGPLLLFEKFYGPTSIPPSRLFWSCSACRSRKDCRAFRWYDDPRPWRWIHSADPHVGISSGVPVSTPTLPLPIGQPIYPTRLLTAREDKCTLTDRVQVLCICTPRIHEELRAGSEYLADSFLLDIDPRFAQFYGPKEFARFNCFNGFYFDPTGPAREFISSCDAIIVDPPFGGVIEALGLTIRRLRESSTSVKVTTIVFLPYFLESRLIAALPDLHMSDYRANYENHNVFNSKKAKRPSAVRLFSSEIGIVLPASEGYALCQPCGRYTHRSNIHCCICGKCPSKDGRVWKHCFSCGTCVKPGRVHCSVCQTCREPDHHCGDFKQVTRCHLCGQQGHRRTSCPNK